MATIYGHDIKEYTVKEVWETGGAMPMLCSVHKLEKGDGPRCIVLDNTHLRYEEYGVDITEEQIRVWGSHRSFLKAFYKFMELLWSNDDLTAAQALTGSIPLPAQPLRDKEDLRRILESLMASDNFLYAQHMATGTDLEFLVDCYTTAAGQGPAVVDFEMCCLRTRSRGEWSRALCHLVEYASRGGIITTMHHWLNPLNPVANSTWGSPGSIENWNAILTRGSEPNQVWHRDLDCAAEFLGALKAAGVTCMFRPMFEANADWFWYGIHKDVTTGDDLVRMWKYVYHYYVEECGFDHLLWTYAPNCTDMKEGSVPRSVKAYYPGDDYCDVVGCDWYTGGNYEIASDIYDGNSYDRLAEYGKPVCLAEWGVDGNGHKARLNTADFMAVFERMRKEGKSLAFVEVYNDGFGAPMTVGKGEAISQCPYIISLEDMPAYIEKVLQ